MNTAAHFSRKTVEWETPADFFAALDAEFHFTLDPCCTAENAKCPKYFALPVDGLKQSWASETVFVNPPYGREIGLWVRRAFNQSFQGATCVCLVPARTDTDWWHRWVMRGEVRFIRGRLKFGDGSNSAPFPSAVVIFRPRK